MTKKNWLVVGIDGHAFCRRVDVVRAGSSGGWWRSTIRLSAVGWWLVGSLAFVVRACLALVLLVVFVGGRACCFQASKMVKCCEHTYRQKAELGKYRHVVVCALIQAHIIMPTN
jgi:hypothetical protein